MIDALREEEIVNKVGGRFKLSTLIQKRLVQLKGGSRPLVEVNTDNQMTQPCGFFGWKSNYPVRQL